MYKPITQLHPTLSTFLTEYPDYQDLDPSFPHQCLPSSLFIAYNTALHQIDKQVITHLYLDGLLPEDDNHEFDVGAFIRALTYHIDTTEHTVNVKYYDVDVFTFMFSTPDNEPYTLDDISAPSFNFDVDRFILAFTKFVHPEERPNQLPPVGEYHPSDITEVSIT